MKNHLLNYLVIVILLSLGCNNECGEDVLLGTYEITAQSKEDWFPYFGVEELKFKNANNEIITLELVNREDKMSDLTVQQICFQSGSNKAEEYIEGQWLFYEYRGVYNDFTYSITVTLNVELNIYNWEPLRYNTYDKISYFFLDERDSYWVNRSGCVELVTDSRGNTLNMDLLTIIPVDYAEEIEINGKIYSNVWYSLRAGTPSLYVQKGKGIIAFLGQNNEVWVLE